MAPVGQNQKRCYILLSSPVGDTRGIVAMYDMIALLLSIVDTVAMFGIEFIIVFTALLLKKRIAIYHSDVTQLLSVSR